MAEAAVSSSSSRSITPPPKEDCIEEKSPKMEAQSEVNEQLKSVDSEVAGSASGTQNLENALDKLLQKQRNELMYELRRIQHGDRPVTGQGNKEAVEQFFTEQRRETSDQARPENVVVEVNALVERRPVSSALSSRFRRSLENALRGAMAGGRSSQAPVRARNSASAVSSQPSVSNAQNTLNSSVSNGQNTVNSSVSNGQTTVRPRHTIQTVTEERETDVGRSTAPQQHRADTVEVARPVESTELPSQRQSPDTTAQAWLQQHNQVAGAPENLWDRIEDVHREELIMEISELVQRQLVTDTLSGNFRNVLERRLHAHVENTGTDGQRTQQFVQSIPQSTAHVRNDFSSLGIHAPADSLSDHLDEVSVVSATAAVTVPYAQSNLALSRELQSLKAQMREMMSMMKLNFDLTMDVQRSVKQEVAAAMSDRTGTAAASGLSSRPASEDQCLICLDKDVDTVLYQCGHMCLCYTCGMTLRQRGSNCPVCRAPIKDIVRAYRCNPKEES